MPFILVAMIWFISSGENISHFVFGKIPSGSVPGSYQYLGGFGVNPQLMTYYI
jgi:hypothetical protein